MTRNTKEVLRQEINLRKHLNKKIILACMLRLCRRLMVYSKTLNILQDPLSI